MELFFDLDGVVYDTFAKLGTQSKHLVADVLTAELEAEPMKGAKDTIDYLYAQGHHCFISTERGKISDDERVFSTAKLYDDGIAPYIIAVMWSQTNKCDGIAYAVDAASTKLPHMYKEDVTTDQIVLVDDNPEHILSVAQVGMRGILFGNNQLQNLVDNEHIFCAKDWNDVSQIVDQLAAEEQK